MADVKENDVTQPLKEDENQPDEQQATTRPVQSAVEWDPTGSAWYM